MPPKADPRDWDRYFRPGAPRRGGPLRALANILLIGVTVGILGGAGLFAWSFGRERARESAATNVSLIATSNAGTIATQTARALATVTTQGATPTSAAAPILGRGSVTSGGNLRREPVVSPDTVVGQICAGDQIEFLEQRTQDDGAHWYRVRLTTAATNCSAQRVTVGSEGWASAQLLSEPAP